MNPRILTGIAAWISILTASPGCGPFFPDTVLDRPQAALDVPPTSYLHDLYRMAGNAAPAAVANDRSEKFSFLRQIPLETTELRDFWQTAGITADEIERRIGLYQSVRKQLLAPIREAGRMSFPTHENQPLALPARPLGEDFPADVADYVEAARLHACGKTAEARTLWKSILERPPAERRLRAAWAAWMLAKTSPDETECLDWYARVETEIQAGASDVIGLREAAKGWRAGRMSDLILAMHFYYDHFADGKESAAIDLRHCSNKILATGNEAIFTAAAADPQVRHLLNLALHATLDGPCQMDVQQPPEEAGKFPPPGWLAALEPHAPLDDGARVAWALYAAGRFDEARKWLGLAVKSDSLSMWLQAKFDLRDGNLNAANQHLADALSLRSKENDWHPANPELFKQWFSDMIERQQANQGRLLADVGIVALARQDYLSAFESLRKGGYREDATYLAEAVISSDGLIKHVRKVAPVWSALPNQDGPIHPMACLTSGYSYSSSGLSADDQLRYLLARRLAREWRLKEAREFMPPDLLPLLDHYIALDRARRSGRYSGAAGAAVVWRQALIHRHLGAELFSTDGAPDGGARGWIFSSIDFSSIRAFRSGWTHQWASNPPFIASNAPTDLANPAVTADEIHRTSLYAVKGGKRFHYRYAAADLAWEAAQMLPKNHPLLSRLYNTAGQWLSLQDPQAADRFYQAMVRRCAKTPEGQAAETTRWFLTDLPAQKDLPALPSEFR